MEDGGADQAALGFVQKVVFPSAGQNAESRGGGQIVHLIGVAAGGVDNEAASDSGHRGVEEKIAAVGPGGVRQADGQGPGGDDPGGGGVQRPPDVGREVGLPPPHLLAAEEGETRHPVGIAALLQLAEGDVVLRLQRQHQGAVDHIVHMEVFRQLGHHGVAFDIVTGHFGARQRIISRVDDAAVGPGGARGHVVVPFDENNPRLGLGQFAGHCAADDAAADDGHVVDGMDICIFHCQPSAFMEFYRDGNRAPAAPDGFFHGRIPGLRHIPALRAFADEQTQRHSRSY